ncbi:related to Translocation protein SEC66 [Hanseniaspora guilliermondii]|uniref:Related to Translocation protein SEC66 n=1 Tax=Hanseniaspora guilliermondii TaxID=56406 RepID=A0A1L0B7D1_9ASCO|nr:related to Translocation protein SEC66 [Hanseniaspora guilliermondii]
MSFNSTFKNGTHSNSSTFENEADATSVQYKNISILTPIIYVTVLLCSLMYLQRYVSTKKHQKSMQTPSIFEDNYRPREVYYAIKEKQYTTSNGSDKIDENALLSALIHRGASVFRYKIKLNETKQTFDILYKLGSMGEDFYERYEREFKLIEMELEDCIREYAELTKGKQSPQRFAEICQNVCFNEAIKRRVAFYDSKVQNKLK